MAIGRCSACALRKEHRRGTSTARGYGQDWVRFRPQFLHALTRAGIVPVCGAALPQGPHTQDSECARLGLLTFASTDGSSLHLDHEPPLEDHERQDLRAVCNPARIQLLCQACHARKADRQKVA